MTRIMLLGDSLMVGTAPYIKQALPKHIFTEYDRVGMPLREGILLAEKHAKTDNPDAIMVSLGTNNSPVEYDYFVRCIDRLRRIVGAQPYIIWATIHRPIGNDKYPYMKWNQYLRRRQSKNRTFLVAEWAYLANQRPSLLYDDHIHATPEGYEARAKLYLEAWNRRD